MSDEDDLGPAMASLSERQRQFVWNLAYGVNGKRLPQWKCADLAGYVTGDRDGKPRNRKKTLAKQAWRLMQTPRVRAALTELAGGSISTASLTAVEFLVGVKDDIKAPLHLRMRAAESLLDRAGLVGAQNISVRHDHMHRDMTGDAMVGRIKELAAKWGMDPKVLLGSNAPEMKVIEHEPAAVDGGVATEAGADGRDRPAPDLPEG